jgi:hypothetical protein
VETFREELHRYPDKAQFAIIADTVGESDDALAFWRAVLIAWRDHGYNRANIAGMLDCFARRELPGRRGATGPPGVNRGNGRTNGPEADQRTTEEKMAAYEAAAQRLGYTR